MVGTSAKLEQPPLITQGLPRTHIAIFALQNPNTYSADFALFRAFSLAYISRCFNVKPVKLGEAATESQIRQKS